MIARDCVNGTWFPDNFNDGKTNYSLMTAKYRLLYEKKQNPVAEIDDEVDITFSNVTKLKINLEGILTWL